jgi:flagellar hook assembly protein FlgD
MKKKLVLYLLAIPLFSVAQNLNINLSKNSLNLTENDSLVYNFYLPSSVTTTIKFVNIFGGEEIVFEREAQRNSGWHQIVLNAESLSTGNHSSGVYYIDVSGKKDGTQTVSFNSFAVPWGESVDVTNVHLNKQTGKISYNLPKTSFVKLRIGFQNGSLVRTLINLEPQANGKNVIFWDGLDQSKKIEINPGLAPQALIIAYAIPATSFYLKNPNQPINFNLDSKYPENWDRLALNPYAKIQWNTNLDVLLQYDVIPDQDKTLKFAFPVQFMDFNNVFTPENEIYISVDNEYIVENPNILVPGNYSIAFPKLPKGKHTVIVNIILPANRIATGISEFIID